MLGQEHKCGFRKPGSVVPLRHAQGNFDISIRLKSLLIRKDVFQHLKAVFANFEKEIGEFMKLSWYDQFLTPEDEADGVADHAGDGVDEDVKQEVSAYVSKGLIMRLCAKLAKGHFELSLCKISTLVCT